VGDAKNVLKKLLEKAEKLNIQPWQKKIKKWKKDYPLKYDKNGFKPQYVIGKISDLTKGDAIIATEVGQNQMWAAQFYRFKNPRTLITSGGLGTMGFGFPAAMGAQVANPDKTVIDIAGDGSIQMNIQELATAVYYKIPVKIIILNNPDFVKLAESFGAIGYRVTTKDEFDKIIKKVLEEKEKPVVVDCRIEPEENVFPMVPAGASLDQMLEGIA